ncbi:hypothetical protein [uncultured Mediterranean phage uvDeep-CGR2-KM18-C74]|nr:hypothetical protein [uncultured Mediterranean phage uvDeep-CGR2-KM18-C74]
MNINPELVEWCNQYFGPNKPFRSARAWALAAGLHPHAVNQILESGKVSARAAVSLAKVAGASPVQVLVIADYLEEQDVPNQLSSEEADLLTVFRQLRPYDQTVLKNIATSLTRTDESPNGEADQGSQHPSESRPL